MEEYKCYVCENNYNEQELARNDENEGIVCESCLTKWLIDTETSIEISEWKEQLNN
jgi:DNA-directed RNA polymerase subunit RPC12/RpoP|tara:strand:+ start:309 stop:476 length:168 start_codon:yes stop_codon:yes gene_type:complete